MLELRLIFIQIREIFILDEGVCIRKVSVWRDAILYYTLGGLV